MQSFATPDALPLRRGSVQGAPGVGNNIEFGFGLQFARKRLQSKAISALEMAFFFLYEAFGEGAMSSFVHLLRAQN